MDVCAGKLFKKYVLFTRAQKGGVRLTSSLVLSNRPFGTSNRLPHNQRLFKPANHRGGIVIET